MKLPMDTSFMNLTEAHQEVLCVNSSFSCLQASPTAADVFLYIAVAVIVSVTVCGNLLVIISICHFRQLQTPTNFLLLSLAMADFLVGVTVMPLYFTMVINPQRCFDILYCATFLATAVYFTTISIYNVALIAVDRCFALSNPFYYSMKVTVNLTLRIIVILWLCSLIYSVMLLYFTGYISDKKDMTCGACTAPDKVSYTIDFILVFLLAFSIIIIMYLNIFAIAKKHANKIRSDRKSQKTTNIGSLASEWKAAKSLGILVAAFLLCLVPFYVSSFLDVYFPNGSVQPAISITTIPLYLNSSINPIIYALFYPWFQKSFKIILTFRICGTDSSVLNVLERDTNQFSLSNRSDAIKLFKSCASFFYSSVYLYLSVLIFLLVNQHRSNTKKASVEESNTPTLTATVLSI